MKYSTAAVILLSRWPMVLLLLSTLAGCGDPEAIDKHQDPEPPLPDNRIAVPEIVRKNLGIAFAPVERRRVAATLRVPGRFELPPHGRREYRAPCAGRIELAVAPLQALQPGAVVYELDAPAWRQTQRELGELATAVEVTTARIAAMAPLHDAHRAHEQSLQHAVAVTAAHIEQLAATQRDVGGQASELAQTRVQLAQLQADLADAIEKHAELQATLAQLDAERRAGRDRFALALAAAATLLGSTEAALQRPAASSEPAVPQWRAQRTIVVTGSTAGVVERLPVAPGTWVDTGELVATTIDATTLWFQAQALQSDSHRLRDDLPVRLLPVRSQDAGTSVAAQLRLGVQGDATQRTLELFAVPERVPPWARPGTAAFAEIETDTGAPQELAIPRAAVLQDGLQRVFFRRDPQDQDRVIRVEADLGVDDGQWIEVKSGLRDGDQVVTTGAYELVLASSQTERRGGHFHADGTFHADDHK